MKTVFFLFCVLSFTPAFTALADAEIPTFKLTIKNHKFTPDHVTAPANTKFKLIVKNEDPGAEEFDSSDLDREKVIPGGKAAEIPLGPLKAGEYRFIGEYHAETAYGSIILK